MRRRAIKISILGASAIAMVLQLLISSAHIHGLDGDKYHHVYTHTAAVPSRTPYTDRHDVHHGHHHHHTHHDHFDFRNGYENRPAHQLSHVNHGPAPHSQDPHPDEEHGPWHACDFSLLFGAFASLDLPAAELLLFKPEVARAFIALQAIERSYATLKGRANSPRAPPSIT